MSGSLVPSGVFEPEGHFLDTPTYGLAPLGSHDALVQAADRWRRGVATMAEYDEAVVRARELFSQIVGVDADQVAIGANVSSLLGPIASAIPAGSTVLTPDGEFTSLLFPFLVQDRINVRTVPLADLADSIDDDVDVVAFSLVQSSSGEIADTRSILRAVKGREVQTMVDATHAAGWLPFDASIFDYVFVAAYKWLLCPRGVAFMVKHSDAEPLPLNAGWYAGEDPWDSIYGGPLRLAESVRKYDTSPAWFSWLGAVPSMELIAKLGVDRINAHNVALANQIRRGVGMAESASAIVTLNSVDAVELRRAGIKASVRASSVRVGCHLYNSPSDVEVLLDALRPA